MAEETTHRGRGRPSDGRKRATLLILPEHLDHIDSLVGAGAGSRGRVVESRFPEVKIKKTEPKTP